MKTAVEWLYENLKSHFKHDGDLFEVVQFSFEHAKEMEKQQSNKLSNVIKDYRKKLDAEVPFGESDSYDVMV
jgi:hypothetical protein